MTTRILRHEVPVDDEWHLLTVSVPRGAIGQPSALHVDCRNMHVVEFWSLESDYAEMRMFRVYGTGAPIPATARYEGTVIAPGGQLVWHLLSAAAEDGTP